jgi:hypothetical protein
MKNLTLLFLSLLFCISVFAQPQNLLSGKYTKDQLSKNLIARDKWVPFPKIDDRAGWAKADQEMMKVYVKKAETFLNYEWPGIPATKSLMIERTGDREEYQSVSFKKREVLGTLLLAEIYENKGRFIDQIIDGVWSICEESFWGVPAHLPKTKELSGLMDVSQPFVELFSAETATFLAWVDYFLGDKLDAVSPQIRKRIYNESHNHNDIGNFVVYYNGFPLLIDDAIKLTKAESVVQHLMTWYPAEVKKPGELIIHYAPEGGKALDFVVKYNPAQFEVSVEKMKLDKMEDKGVLKNWGDNFA